jgi:hypothetical protein
MSPVRYTAPRKAGWAEYRLRLDLPDAICHTAGLIMEGDLMA